MFALKRSFLKIFILILGCCANHAFASNEGSPDPLDINESASSESFVDIGVQRQWPKFRDQMILEVQKASQSFCGSEFLPRSIALSAEFIKVKWELKELCSPRILSQIAALNASRRVNDSGLGDETVLIDSPRKTQDFIREVAQFICQFPALPSEVDLKLPPVALDWNVTAMCRKHSS